MERVVAAVFIAFLLFAAYSYFSTGATYEPFVSMNLNKQMYEEGPKDEAPLEASLTRIVSPGGPSAPSQRPPINAEATIAPEERPFDPQDQSYESADMPDRLRHPERSFGPGLINTDTETAQAAGTANYAQQVTSQSYQKFGPEFAQNGGLFMENGVIANDTTVDLSYSAL